MVRNTATKLTVVRQLRRTSTEAERALWELLRNRRLDGMKFRRQVPMGRFVVDFACLAARIVVEADGAPHFPRPIRDVIRDQWLASRGFTVLRFSNDEILFEPERVLKTIHAAGRDLSA